MSVSVLLGMLLVVLIIGAGSVWGLPARIRLRDMGDYGPIVGGNRLVDGFEGRIVGHHVFPRFRFHLHAHDFIDLHRDRSLREVSIELADRALGECRILEVVRVKRCTEKRPASRDMGDLEHVAPLRLQPLAERITVIDHNNVENAQVQTLEEIPKSRVILIKMNVRVKRRQSRKIREIGRRRQGGLGSG